MNTRSTTKRPKTKKSAPKRTTKKSALKKPAPKKPAPKKPTSKRTTKKRATKKHRAGKQKQRPSGKRIAYWLAALLLWGGIALALVVGYIALGLPDTSKLPLQLRSPSISLLARDGELLARRGNTGGEAIKASELPSHVRDAVISIEDRRFFHHYGIDVRGILRAGFENLLAGELRQGGSTITQQLAKNLFLTPERSVTRKIREALLAIWLETRLTKEEILSLYLNRAYFGAGAYGIDAAARQYFGKSAKTLSLHEAALLAGLLKAPSRYAPSHDSSAALQRADLVLRAMLSEGYIDAKTAGDAEGDVSISMLSGSLDVNYAVDWLAARIPYYLGGQDEDVVARTTLDTKLQRHAEDVIAEAFTRESLRDKDIQVALVAMDVDGSVLAMVGGRDYRESRFNRAAQARRQPGSAFKPAVYLAAIESGFSSHSKQLDAPVSVDGWQPQNYSGHYRGEVTLEEALAHSINSVAVRLSEEVGRKRVIEAARRMGITEELRASPSLPLGVFEISPIELVSAYAPFANGGYIVAPHGITELREADGTTLYKREGSGGGRAVNARELDEMNRMMRKVLEYGTGKQAHLGERPAAGKTGTSQNFRDAWFVGYTAQMLAVVWIGRDSGKPMEEITGSTFPAEIWRAFMLRAHEGMPLRPLP
ncbi:MAG: PBP1A family penicillin-binding protein [Hyphomicrobiales bacterium]|nr:PBP1A family penicillin-binding protein [Hyphomicrobiales bacterium]